MLQVANSASGGRGVAEFVIDYKLSEWGEGCSRVCHITNSASGGRGVAEFVINSLLVGGTGRVAEFLL